MSTSPEYVGTYSGLVDICVVKISSIHPEIIGLEADRKKNSKNMQQKIQTAGKMNMH